MIIKNEVLFSHDNVYIKRGCPKTASGGYQVLPQKIDLEYY